MWQKGCELGGAGQQGWAPACGNSCTQTLTDTRPLPAPTRLHATHTQTQEHRCPSSQM